MGACEDEMKNQMHEYMHKRFQASLPELPPSLLPCGKTDRNRQMYADVRGGMLLREAAVKYGITAATVWSVVTRLRERILRAR